VIVELGGPKTFDHVVLGETIEKGQRIARFYVEAENENGTWSRIAEATTIGYKRILQVDPVSTSKIKVVVEESTYPPLISEVGLYYSGD
jgi:alpha-L-fucosidase